MAVAFDPDALPPTIRPLVERALAGREGHEDAIRAIEAHLAAGGDRSPDLLVALATLTYDDAAAVVLHRLGQASERAMALLDEAAAVRGTGSGLEALREAFESAWVRERTREARRRLLLVRPDRAKASELAELAHEALMAGDDQRARILMDEATRRAELDDLAAEPEDAAEAG